MSEVSYLGHVLSSKGMAPDKQKVSAVQEWPTPDNASEFRHLYIPRLSFLLPQIYSQILQDCYITSHIKMLFLHGIPHRPMPLPP